MMKALRGLVLAVTLLYALLSILAGAVGVSPEWNGFGVWGCALMLAGGLLMGVEDILMLRRKVFNRTVIGSFLFALLCTVTGIWMLSGVPAVSGCALMMAGGLLLLVALRQKRYSWVMVLVGGLVICVAAVINGLVMQNFHISHHVARFLFSGLLVWGSFWNCSSKAGQE